MKSMRSRLVKAFTAVILASASVSAAARVITFDDVPNVEYHVPNTYGGLNWFNVYTTNGASQPGTGFAAGVVSGQNVAGNGFGKPAFFSWPIAFNLESLYLTKAWYAGYTRLEGYSGASLVYTAEIYSTTTAPTFAELHWTNLTKVVFMDADGSEHTVIDDITITSVPEPETYAMLLAGLGIISAIRRLKRTAA